MPSVCDRMQEDLQLAGIATRTQESYLGAVRRFADYVLKDPLSITEDDLRQYFLYLRNQRKLSRSLCCGAAEFQCGITGCSAGAIDRCWRNCELNSRWWKPAKRWRS